MYTKTVEGDRLERQPILNRYYHDPPLEHRTTVILFLISTLWVNHVKPSFFMPAPIKHTCPDIDYCIKQIRSSVKLAEGKYIDESNYKDCLKEIIDSLYRLDDRLEELRDANRALREWGEELEHELSFL